MASDMDPTQDEQDAQAHAGDTGQSPPRGWAGWVISGAFHGLMLLIMMSIYWVVHQETIEYPPLAQRNTDPEKPKQREPTPNPPTDMPIEIKVETPVENPLTQVVVDDTVSTTESEQDALKPKGDPNEISDSQLSGQGFSMAIGAGSGDAGLHGIPNGGGRKRLTGGPGGAPSGSERTVNAALRWFKRHQSPNGSWDPVNYPRNCSADPKCEPGVVNHGTPDGATVAMTGYALMCFLSAGYDHTTPSQFRSVVRHGLDYLLSVQHADGALGDRNYENAIASMALSEAFAMSDDATLKTPAQRAVDVILQRQNQGVAADGHDAAYGGGLGWDYAASSDRNDSSVTGWNIMALKDALAAGLKIGNGLENAKRWLNLVWRKQNPDGDHIDPYHGESRFPYTYLTGTGAIDIAPAPGPGQPVAGSHDLTCVGAVAAVFLGHRSGDPMLESLVNYVDQHEMPTAYPCNTYYMYYNTMAVFMASPNPRTDPRWQRWNTKVMPMFMAAQRHDGCFDGSWDSQGTVFPGNEVGRVLSTAYCTLCMEVYYRHVHLIGGKWVYGDL
jgi:hypothetical protein